MTIRRYLRSPDARDCVMCRFSSETMGPDCPGHHYAVLPGGGVEAGETPRQAAERELAEECTLVGTAGALLWTSTHNGREASYFFMEGVTGVAELSGDEARENCPTNSFQLLWSTAADLDKLALYPTEVKDKLRELVLRAC